MSPLCVICRSFLGRKGRTRQLSDAKLQYPIIHMGRFVACLILCSVAGRVSAANPAASVPFPVADEQPVVTPQMVLSLLDSGDIPGAERQVSDITDQAAKLFVKARIEQAKGDPRSAIQTLSQLIVRYSSDTNWIERSDLLCAELYMELGLLPAADVTARQVQILYEGTESAKKAAALRAEIKKLKEDAK